MYLSLNISDVIKLKLFTHKKSKQSCVGVRTPFNGTAYSVVSPSAPHWNYSITAYKRIFSHENCFKARKQNARTLSFRTATDHKIHFKKKHHESQHNPMECLCFDKNTFLENINWHTSKQLSLQKLMYTLTVIVTDIVVFWIPLSPQGNVACVIQSKRNDSKKISSWRVQTYFPVWVLKGVGKDCDKI